MSFECCGILDLTFPAGESLTLDQYRYVVLDTDGTVRRCNDQAADSIATIGVLQNAPAAAAAAVVRIIGVSKIVCAESISTGEYCTPEYVDAADAGKALHADTAVDIAVGRLLQGGGAEELGTILLSGDAIQVLIQS